MRLIFGVLPAFLVMSCLILTGCSGLSENQVEQILTEKQVYPKIVESVVFCNDGHTAEKVIAAGLVRDGFVTAQLKHTAADIGKPLVYFTDKAKPYLLPTSDTLRSFDAQKIRVATEYLARVVKVEVSASGNSAVVDYVTVIKDQTPLAVLYGQDLGGEHPRRTFFTRANGAWEWNGRIVKMLPR